MVQLSEGRELLVEHLLPGAAAEAPLQHPLPPRRHHQQRQIGGDHQFKYTVYDMQVQS
jgi:hypothetical protein